MTTVHLRIIDRVTGNKALLESTRQDIIKRTDGIPLFVEEMTKAVLEAEGEWRLRARSQLFHRRALVCLRASTHH